MSQQIIGHMLAWPWPWPSECLLIEAVNETGRIYNRSQHIYGWNLELILLVGILLPPMLAQWHQLGQHGSSTEVHFSSVTQSCPTLCDPMDYNLPGSFVLGIIQTRILEGVAISSSRESCPPKDGTCISCLCCIDRQILYPCNARDKV